MFSLTYGVLFQEYEECKKHDDKIKRSTLLGLFWNLSTMFIVMAFLGNLKSSLVRKKYEDRTMTLYEMFEKDMAVYITKTFSEYLGSTITENDLSARILNQAEKKDSIVPLT